MAHRPMFLFATGAAAAVAAGALVISGGMFSGVGTPAKPQVAAGTDGGTKASSSAGGTGASPAATQIDTRSFLLAAADTALRETARSGEYWYVRQRTTQRINHVPDEYINAVNALDEERQRELDQADGSAERAAAERRYKRKLEKLKEKTNSGTLPYKAFQYRVRETWWPKRVGGLNRTTTTQQKVIFGSAEDKAKWKRAGSPKLLWPSRSETKEVPEDRLERPLSISNPDITMRNVGDLPTSKRELARRLRAQFDKRQDREDGFGGYLWQTTVDLMTAPSSPGTRAALYRLLADQKDISSNGQVKDATGRPGVGLAFKESDGMESRLIVDEDTAELLEYSVAKNGEDGLRVTYEESGWTDKLGRRPQG